MNDPVPTDAITAHQVQGQISVTLTETVAGETNCAITAGVSLTGLMLAQNAPVRQTILGRMR